MAVPSQQLAVSSGVALRQDGPTLHFVALGTNSLRVASFVLGLCALVFSVNGLLQLGLALSGGGLLALGLVLTPLGFALAYGARRAWMGGAAREQYPTSALRVLASLDLAQGVLRDGAGRVLAPLGQVRFETRFQATSSSRRLVVCWSGGELTLVQGSPFAGGLWAISDELGRRGFVVH